MSIVCRRAIDVWKNLWKSLRHGRASGFHKSTSFEPMEKTQRVYPFSHFPESWVRTVRTGRKSAKSTGITVRRQGQVYSLEASSCISRKFCQKIFIHASKLRSRHGPLLPATEKAQIMRMLTQNRVQRPGSRESHNTFRCMQNSQPKPRHPMHTSVALIITQVCSHTTRTW
jgi:hypothetical protein